MFFHPLISFTKPKFAFRLSFLFFLLLFWASISRSALPDVESSKDDKTIKQELKITLSSHLITPTPYKLTLVNRAKRYIVKPLIENKKVKNNTFFQGKIESHFLFRSFFTLKDTENNKIAEAMIPHSSFLWRSAFVYDERGQYLGAIVKKSFTYFSNELILQIWNGAGEIIGEVKKLGHKIELQEKSVAEKYAKHVDSIYRFKLNNKMEPIKFIKLNRSEALFTKKKMMIYATKNQIWPWLMLCDETVDELDIDPRIIIFIPNYLDYFLNI